MGEGEEIIWHQNQSNLLITVESENREKYIEIERRLGVWGQKLRRKEKKKKILNP